MKKSFVFAMCALGVFSMLGTSCKKTDENTTGGKFSYNIISMENDDFEGRVFIDVYNQPRWQQNDIVRVYNIDLTEPDGYLNSVSGEFTAVDEDGATVTTLQGNPVGAMMGCYMAYYPGDDAHTTGMLEAGNKETFTLDATQTVQVDGVTLDLNIDRKALAMASRIDAGTHFPFKAICGIARIKLRQEKMVLIDGVYQGKYVVDKIELTDNHWTLNGQVAMNLPALNANDITTMTNEYKANGYEGNTTMANYAASIGYEAVAPGTKTIMLDCTAVNESYRIPTPSTAKYFYFGLRPFALGEGFVLKVYCHENGSAEAPCAHCITVNNWNQVYNHAYTVEPNRIKNFTYILPENIPAAE